MDESLKNKIMIGVVVLALVVAGVMAYRSFGGGGSNAKVEGTVWMMCANPDCGAQYELDKKEYVEAMRGQDQAMMMMTVPALTCKECGQQTAYQAVKCEKCETVFFRNSVPNDYSDRCPQCGFSAIEEKRSKR